MRLHILAFTLILGACSNTVSTLNYMPTIPTVKASSAQSIGAVAATDQRKEAPNRLATIMGGFGNPLKTLDTAKPVKDEVADAFTNGLRLRGLLASGSQGPFQLALVIRKFDADMILGRTARIDMTMSVTDAAGRSIYQDSATDTESDMKFFQTGVFAEIADLRVLSEKVLSKTVDRMLDNPAFRRAVERAGGATS